MGRAIPRSVKRITSSEASRTSHWAEHLTAPGAGAIASGGGPEGRNEQLSNLLSALNTGGSSPGGVPRPSGISNTADTSSRGIQQVNIQDLQNILQGMAFQQDRAQATAEAGPTPSTASRSEVPRPMEEEEKNSNVGQDGSGDDHQTESVPEQPATGELTGGTVADLSSATPPSESTSENQNVDQKSPE